MPDSRRPHAGLANLAFSSFDGLGMARLRPPVRVRTLKRSPDTARGRRTGPIAIAAALLTLMVVAIVGSVVTNRRAAQTQRAVLVNAAYQKAATGVEAEESLERSIGCSLAWCRWPGITLPRKVFAARSSK
jgi:hypothetical protein